MHIGVITLFPEMFVSLNASIPGRAQKLGMLSLQFWNPRDFAKDKHKMVDDRPYGGGPGMVMKVQPLYEAIQTAKLSLGDQTQVIYLSPQGEIFNQDTALKLAEKEKFILVSGRYEGVDERLLTSLVDNEYSIGDFVLSGGELPAMCIIDAVTRLIPGVVGDEESVQQDSFVNNLLDYPHFTRPEKILGQKVPEVLLSGNHQAIARWRLKQALGRTWLKRPDLLKKHHLNKEEEFLLAEFIQELSMLDINSNKV